LTLKSLTLAGGQATGDARQITVNVGTLAAVAVWRWAGLGGAIFQQGSLNLLQDTLTGNIGPGGRRWRYPDRPLDSQGLRGAGGGPQRRRRWGFSDGIKSPSLTTVGRRSSQRRRRGGFRFIHSGLG